MEVGWSTSCVLQMPFLTSGTLVYENIEICGDGSRLEHNKYVRHGLKGEAPDTSIGATTGDVLFTPGEDWYLVLSRQGNVEFEQTCSVEIP
mmetsp:Transcript_13274/g.26967  ORF Transcript_13274/g.26967 Transcript_13274/m.26967 type:complete len:91 (+) Transcript_13274:269-541(+)